MLSKISIWLLLCLIAASPISAATPGDQAPECQALDIINNQPLKISNLRNKVVYLDFWASWCPPCKKSFPVLDRLQQEFEKEDFEVIAVNLDENKNDALEFLQNNSVSFTIVYDGEGKCPEAFEVMGMPSSYIIDKNGVVQSIHLGFNDDSETEIRNTLLTLLSK